MVEYFVLGEYLVILMVFNVVGSSMIFFNMDIEVLGLFELFFFYDIDSFMVVFGNLIDNYIGVKWEFGDGNEIEVDFFIYIYEELGIYMVSLFV